MSSIALLAYHIQTAGLEVYLRLGIPTILVYTHMLT